MMLPGGELSGTVKPAPSDWKFSNAYEDVQLETRLDDPYSVNIWGVAVGKRFMIASGRGLENAWAQHIEADPNVRLRIGEDIYELRAVRTDHRLDRRRLLAAMRAKYEFEPDEGEADEAVIFVLEPR
jgi:hypothetical protein